MSVLEPYLDYCSSSWYSSITVSLRNRLDVVQRKMIRFVHGYDSRHHIDSDHFRDLSWLTMKDRVSYFKMTHLFKIRMGSAPPYLSPGFISLLDTHAYSTRGSVSNYRLSKDLALSPSSFVFTAVKLWNQLPNPLKLIDSPGPFKRKLKQHLLSTY